MERKNPLVIRLAVARHGKTTTFLQRKIIFNYFSALNFFFCILYHVEPKINRRRCTAASYNNLSE